MSSSTDGPRAVVVGAGVFGAAVADALAGRGWQVTIVEQHTPGHVRASSGGESRIIRSGHGPETWYTRSAYRALAGWRSLADDVGERLLEPCGLVWFARNADGWEAICEQTLRAEGIPVERLEPASLRNLFPDVAIEDLAFGLFEPEAGLLHARRAVQALVRRACSRGAVLRTGRAVPAEGGRAAEVDGEVLAADRVVWACGPWLPPLVRDHLTLRVTRQDVVFFGAPPAWRCPDVPAWVDYHASVYGGGDVDGRGFKCAPDIEGEDFDPDTADRQASSANLDLARDYLRRRFPALADAPVVGTRTCQYTLTADTHFVIAPLDDTNRAWVVGGASGHGFKHGPALGQTVADMLTGDAPVEERFALTARSSGPGLRTAGGRSAPAAVTKGD